MNDSEIIIGGTYETSKPGGGTVRVTVDAVKCEAAMNGKRYSVCEVGRKLPWVCGAADLRSLAPLDLLTDAHLIDLLMGAEWSPSHAAAAEQAFAIDEEPS